MDINPYLFLLLKRIIETNLILEVGRLPSKRDIGYIIADYFFKQEKPIGTHADRFRKIWSFKSFEDADEIHLDFMARFVNGSRKYNSWQHFVSIEGRHNYAKSAERIVGPYEKCDRRVKRVVTFMVEQRAVEICLGLGFRLKQVILSKNEIYELERRRARLINEIRRKTVIRNKLSFRINTMRKILDKYRKERDDI